MNHDELQQAAREHLLLHFSKSEIDDLLVLERGEPQRTKAIARDIAYHGVTLGALSFTGVERFKTPFGRPAIDVTHVSNTNAFRAPDGDDPDAFRARLLAEVEDAIVAAGPDEVA